MGTAGQQDPEHRNSRVDEHVYAPVQFVVVQQTPGGEAGGGFEEWIKKLFGKDDDDKPEKDPAMRKVAVTLSQYNLITVIALLVLMVVGVIDVILRVTDRNPGLAERIASIESNLKAIREKEKGGSDGEKPGAEINGSNEAIAKLGESLHELVGKISPPSSNSPKPIIVKRDSIPPEMVPLLAKLATNGAPQFVPVPVAFPLPPSFSSAQPEVPKEAVQHKVPRLPDFNLTCFSSLADNGGQSPSCKKNERTSPSSYEVVTIEGWSAKFAAAPPPTVVAHYAVGESGLEVLGFQYFLTVDLPSATQDLAGLCQKPDGGYTVWKNGDHTEDVQLKLGPFWNAGDERKASKAWKKSTLYLTLCVTARSPELVPILRREVYRLQPKNDAEEVEGSPIKEEVVNVVLQQ